MQIKWAIYSVLILSVLRCTIENSQTPADTYADDEETLRFLKEVEWPKAYAEQDTLLLDRILGADFQMIDNGGDWYSRSDELDWIKKNRTAHDSFCYDIKRLDILPNGTAVLCGTGHIFNDSSHAIYQSSNILIKRQGTWKAVASHVSGFKSFD